MTIKFIHSAMVGAPVLSGTAGAMAALLDAALVTGFGVKSATVMVAGGIATATVAAPHAFDPLACILVASATPTSLNGEKVVTARTATTVSWATTEADGAATGAITIKVAPLGWSTAFTGANVRAYKPVDVMASGCLLRIDDTGTTNSRAAGYLTMSDVNAGAGAFPLPAQVAGGAYWPKSATASGAARSWVLIGDGRAFYLCVNPGSSAQQSIILFFGDIVSNKSGDAYGCAIYGPETDASNSAAAVGCMGFGDKAGNFAYVARAANTLGGSQACRKVGAVQLGGNGYSGQGSYALTNYPNDADNGLLFCDVLALSGSGVRGKFPGLLHVPQSLAQDAFQPLQTESGTDSYTGKTVVAMRPGAPSSSAAGNYGLVFFDITGPWR